MRELARIHDSARNTSTSPAFFSHPLIKERTSNGSGLPSFPDNLRARFSRLIGQTVCLSLTLVGRPILAAACLWAGFSTINKSRLKCGCSQNWPPYKATGALTTSLIRLHHIFFHTSGRAIVYRQKMPSLTARKIVLTIHLYLGLAAGIFLAILGLTGSVMAFEGDIDHWLHPDLWYVTPARKLLPQNDLVSIAQNRFHSRVLMVQFPRASNLAQVMQMADGTTVYLNPYDGTVLGSKVGQKNSDRVLGYIHQIHLRLVPDPRSAPQLAEKGKIVVSCAGLVLLLIVPTGVILWWRAKRLTVKFKATNFKIPWHRVFHDSHQAIGIYAALFLTIASFTGILIGFGFGEKFFYAVTKSSPPPRPQPAPSTLVPGVAPMMADEVLDIARRALPNATPSVMVRPLRATGSYTVLMRVPEETSEAVHSSVTIDQYSGKVLALHDYLTESSGYRAIRFNRSIHTGDIFGLASHIVVSVSSLALAAMVVTGFVIWWKKLAE
jgi:uncharacterized iron-regulated membrane protein